MKKIIPLVLVLISLFTSVIFGIDKITSENPSDSATIRISLSDIDSSGCELCSKGGIYYESGCKMCIQDGVMFGVSSSENGFYEIGWSNNDGMYHGDINCDGQKHFPKTFRNANDKIWVEIVKNELELRVSLYNDSIFSDPFDSVSITMCSNPTELRYLRVSIDDGKPSGNGGKLVGSIDDVKIWNVGVLNNKKSLSFSTTFDNCTDKTCSDQWVLQNSNRIFVDSDEGFLRFISEVSGMLDYAHLELDEPVSDNSWIMRFKFSLDEVEQHPHGKGVLKIEPTLRQLVLGIPSLILPIVSFFISGNVKSRSFGIMIILSGLLIISGVLFNLVSLNENITKFNSDSLIHYFGVSIFGITIVFLGIKKCKDSIKNYNI